MHLRSVAMVAAATLACAAASAIIAAQTAPAPPPGFTALFNGQDLSGWRGRPGGGGVFSPYVEATFTPEERAAKQKEWNARDRRGRGQVVFPPAGQPF
jgi:opacity protein-like surface antigen